MNVRFAPVAGRLEAQFRVARPAGAPLAWPAAYFRITMLPPPSTVPSALPPSVAASIWLS